MYYYNNQKEITSEEAHALTDRNGLIVSGEPQTFKKENKKEKKKK